MLPKRIIHISLPFLSAIILCVRMGWCEDIGAAPASLQVALFLKLLAFNNNIASGSSVTIHVIGASEFATEMKKFEGKPLGGATLAKVTEGDGVSEEIPSVIYIGSEAKVKDILAYTKSNKVLSITGNPALVSKDVSLIVGVSDAKPKVVLNPSASKDEGVEWNPAIFKVAVTTR